MKIKKIKNTSVTTKENWPEHKIKSLLAQEVEFLTNLWKRLPIPTSSLELKTDDDNEHEKPAKKKKISVFKKEGEEGTTRAANVEELQEKVNALKTLKGSKKIHVKERIKKKGLKHKLAKSKKKAERKMNKVLVKPQKSPPEPLTEPKLEKITKAPKPVFNSQGKLVFSKFDFSEMGAQGTGRSALKSKGPKSPGKILQKIQKHKEKLQQLESEGKTEAAQELKQKEAWRSALRKAQGEKVKDDPLLLKKSVRKVKDRKKQSTDKWAARNEHVKRTLEERQHKRNTNIQKRKKEVKLKKIKKAVKKGRIIPGH